MSENITISPQRKIGDIDADCTILEQGADTYTPTRHPVEQGAAITDHVYREPATLTMQIGFSNASAQADGSNDYVIEKYKALLALQATRQPLDVITGKRAYKNMIIAGLSVRTDQESEAALLCTCTMTEIIIVTTQVTSVASPDVQADPEQTAATQERGSIQPRPAALSPSPLVDTLTAQQGGSLGDVQEIPLVASPQSFSIQLDNVPYQMTATWRDVASSAVGDATASVGGGWMLDMADQVGMPIISGIPLVTGSNLLAQYAYLGIGQALVVQTSHDVDAVPTYDNLGAEAHVYAVATGG